MSYTGHMRIVNEPHSAKSTKSVSQRMTNYSLPDIEAGRSLFRQCEPKSSLRWILEITDMCGRTVLTLPSGTVQELRNDPNGSGVWFVD